MLGLTTVPKTGMACTGSRAEGTLTDEDRDGGGAQQAADDDGRAVAAVRVQAAREVVGHGVHEPCRVARTMAALSDRLTDTGGLVLLSSCFRRHRLHLQGELKLVRTRNEVVQEIGHGEERPAGVKEVNCASHMKCQRYD